MNRVVITGLGIVSSIGNTLSAVSENLRTLTHGFEPFPAIEGEKCPPKLIGSIKEFDTSSHNPEDWIYPDRFTIKRAQIRSMSPHVLFSHCALLDALDDAGLSREEISSPGTGLYSASAGSPSQQHHQLSIMDQRGVMRTSPFAVVTSTVGTINFNLGASFKIKGSICGMASACASSAHALGLAYDQITTGRQDRMIVIGAEDGDRYTLLPFAAMRALSTKEEPALASCPFDTKRNGFVGTGGAAVMILESEKTASERGAREYCELAGWGQAGDGHSPAMSHPEGEGLQRAMENALRSCGIAAEEIDYINAHGTSTSIGDVSELRAIKSVFDEDASIPAISSTKAITGHGLSMAGTLEGAICSLSMKEGFTPGSAHITELDPEAGDLNIIRETVTTPPKLAMSNSSGFGGANVSLVLKKR